MINYNDKGILPKELETPRYDLIIDFCVWLLFLSRPNLLALHTLSLWVLLYSLSAFDWPQ